MTKNLFTKNIYSFTESNKRIEIHKKEYNKTLQEIAFLKHLKVCNKIL